MRVLPPPEPSLASAFFCAPLVAPVLAIPAVSLLPGVYTNVGDLLLVVPFVIVLSLLHAYAGMLLVCLPVMGVLKLTGRFDALRLCFYTTLIGASAWTCLFTEPSSASESTAFFVVATLCSFGVSAFFCALGGVKLRSR